MYIEHLGCHLKEISPAFSGFDVSSIVDTHVSRLWMLSTQLPAALAVSDLHDDASSDCLDNPPPTPPLRVREGEDAYYRRGSDSSGPTTAAGETTGAGDTSREEGKPQNKVRVWCHCNQHSGSLVGLPASLFSSFLFRGSSMLHSEISR